MTGGRCADAGGGGKKPTAWKWPPKRQSETDVVGEAQIGYGLPAFAGRFTATPRLRRGTAADGNENRLGWRLSPARDDMPDMTLGLEAARYEPDGGHTEHRESP